MRGRYLFILLPFLTACGPAANDRQETESSVEDPASGVLSPPEIYCYRNVFPYSDGSGLQDVQEMTLILMNDLVTGALSSVPAEKDSRKGKLTGTRRDDVLDLRYVFMQEGILDTGMIRVTLTKDAALLSSEDPGLWVPEKIGKIACEE